MSEDGTGRLQVAAHLPCKMGSSLGATANASLDDFISPCRPSPAQVDTSHDVDSTLNVSSWVLRLTIPPYTALSVRLRTTSNDSHCCRSTPSSSVSAGWRRRFGGLHDSRLLAGSGFPSSSKNLLHFRNWLDGRRFPAIPIVLSQTL